MESMRNEYFKNGILSKYYHDDNLLLLYTNYNDDHKKLRSKVIEPETQKVVSYSFNSPMYNYNGYNYLINNQDCEKKFTKCYEGTIISVFWHNKWYVSTRKCLKAQESIWVNKSFYQMFEETILQDFNSIEEFYNILNKDYNYHFVLVHWENKNIVDYTEEFGEQYKKLGLALVRDKDMNIIDTSNINEVLNLKSIFIPKEYDDYSQSMNLLNNEIDYMNRPKLEGVIVKVKNNNDVLIIKLQTNHYQFYKAMGLEEHLYRGFLNLYQKDKLLNFFQNNEYNFKYSKLINPHNNNQTYDLVGVIDGVFKVLSQELLVLYNNLYDKDNKKPNNYYNKLPVVYKNIIYKMRGISIKKNNQGLELSLKNIYTLLKMVETDVIYSLLRNRKMMMNYNKIKENIFPNLSENIQKIHLKLCAIYTTKLFPDLLDIDTF